MFHTLRCLFKQSLTLLKEPRPAIGTRLFFEEMEPRTLYSADPVGGLIDTTGLLAQETLYLTSAETLMIDADSQNSESSNNDSSVLDSKDQTFTSNISTEIRHELVIVDASVENYEQLIDDLIANGKEARDISVFVLDNENDGIEQITEELQNYDDLDALHIISHGTKGAVVLGNTQLSSSNLDNYSASIAQWQNSFDPEADLLIYGCELAGNAAGKALTAELSVLTGADVAASVDDTGNSIQGGNWQLEFSTGDIETNIAFSKQIQQSWGGLLAFETYRDEFNDTTFVNSDGSQNWETSGWQEIGEIDGSSLGLVIVSTELTTEQGLVFKQSNNGAFREVNLSGATSASLSFEYARISLDNASESVVLEISDDGGSTWSQLDSWQGANDDTSLIFASYDISNYIAANTQIRFVTNGFNEANDRFFVDNVQIAYNNNLGEKAEFLINSPDGFSQETSSQDRGSHQAVAVASNGDYVVVWTEVELAGDLSDVFVQQFNADGTTKGVAFQVNSNSTNHQQWASVATDASGRFVVVWTSQDQDGSGQGVYLKRFDELGIAIDTNDILVNSGHILGNQSAPTVAVNSQGKMVITWQSDASVNPGIYAKTFDMSSSTTANSVPTGLIFVDFGSNRINPSVDINTEGKFMISWEQNNDTYFRLFNPDGSFRSSQIKTNSFSIDAKYQDVLIRESGDLIIADWSNGVGGIGRGIWISHYDDDGIKKSFFNISNSSKTIPTIAKDLNGNFIVVYQGTGDGGGLGVFAQKYNSNLSLIGTEFLINETTVGDQQMASIAMLDLDNFVVVWSGNGNGGDTDGVYGRQFTAANNPPTADAGSSYIIAEGDSVTLDGSNSSDPDLDSLSFSWDLNGDSNYGDVVGEIPAIAWTTLQSNGINDDGVYTIGLQVDDGKGGVDTTTTTIIVNNQAPVLSTTGNATINLGSVYTLNLSVTDSGADTISSWTINWGDGTIDTFAGNPATVIHTYTNGGFTNNILASATDEDGTYLQNPLVVGDFSTDSVFSFDTTSGALRTSEFATGNGINNPVDVKIGPDGLLYVSSEGSKDVLRYNASTGAFVDIFINAASTTNSVEGIAFGPDGNLYVAYYDGMVVRFDATTGLFMDVFVAMGLGGLDQAYGITFGPDNNLYVNSYNNDNVIKYNGITGELIGEFVTTGSGGLDIPEEMVFGPDGNLYVTSFNSDDVLRYNGSTGAFIDKFIDSNAAIGINGGLLKPAGLAFGADGNLYVSDFTNGAIRRYDGTIGDYIDDYVAAGTGGLTQPVFLEFLTQQQVTIIPSANNQPTTIGLVDVMVNEDAPDSIIDLLTAFTDVEDQDTDLIYTIQSNTNAGLFTASNLDAAANTLTLDYAPNQNGTSDITIRATDSGGKFIEAMFTVTVTAVNDTPTTSGLADVTVNENAPDSVIDLLAAFTDVEDLDTDLIYSIQSNTNASLFTANTLDSVANTLTLDYALNQNGTSGITLRATDSGGEFIETSFIVTVNAVNNTPTTSGLVNVTVIENAPNSVIDLLAVFTDVEDLDTDLIYTIQGNTNAGLFAASTLDAAANTLTLDYAPNQNGTSDITLRATDSGGEFIETSFTVTVNAVNNTPTANGLANVTVNENAPDSVIDLLTAFTDVEDSDTDLIYTIQGNTNAGLFTASTLDSVANTLTLDYALNQNGTSDITLRATDSGGEFIETSFTVTVNAINNTPTANGLANVTVNENAPDSVIDLLTAFTDVEDSDIDLIYTIQGNTNAGLFTTSTLDSVANILTLNYAPNQNGTSDITLRATDSGGEFIETSFTVTVNAVNNTPTTSGLAEVTVNENAPDSVIDLLAAFTDVEDQDTDLIYTIQSNTNTGLFTASTLDAAANTLTLDYAPNQNGSSDITIQATDSGGEFVETSFTVTVTTANNTPIIENQTFSISENSVDGTTVGTVIASDSDPADSMSFSIIAGNSSNTFSINSSTGEITIADGNQLNFENTSNFNLTVQVTDNGIGNLSNTASVNINLININEAPDSISLSNTTVDENIDTSSGFTIGLLTSTDADGADAATYIITGGADQVKFAVGGDGNNELIITDGVLDFAEQSSYEVSISVTDNGGLSYQESFVITLNNLNDQPIITSNDSIMLFENNNSVITVVATDADQPVQTLSYSVSGGVDSTLFFIDSNTGALSFKAIPDFENPLDSNNDNIYQIEVTVDDSNGGTFSQNLSIQIDNAPEAPSLQDQSFVLDQQIDTGTLVTTMIASDPDQNETLVYSIEDSTLPGAFSIDNNGLLIVQNNTALINLDNSLISLTIKVTDNQGLTGFSTVQIDVSALQEEVVVEPEDNLEQDNEVESEKEISQENEIESEPEKEIDVELEEEEFSFSILTKIPSEEAKFVPQNQTNSESDFSATPEQQKNQSETVEEVNEKTNTEVFQNPPIAVGLGKVENTTQDGLSLTRQSNFDVQRSDFSQSQGRILIKVKSFIESNRLNPEFSYFNIDTTTLQFLLEESGFSDSLDSLRKQALNNTQFEKTVIGSSVTVATGISIGYVIWLIRGGVLLSSVLSSLPAWRMIDPLPVIAHLNDSSNNHDDDDNDSLESLIKKGSETIKSKAIRASSE